jgi:hypothetical protein
MKWIAAFLISSSWVLAGTLENLTSPSQQVRDEAAGELRKTFVLPPRKAWDELAASIKPGDTRASVMDRLKPLNAKRGAGVGSGQTSSESYHLDGAWVLWIAFVRLDATKTGDEAMTVTKATVQEHLQHIWVEPPEGYSGTWTTYYINGQRSHEVHYEGGRHSGEFTAFRSDGSKACVQHYGPNGAEGEETGYFPSGRLAYRGLHKVGKPVGTWTHYNEDGSVQSTKEYPEQGK